jgi:hypothetical protein
MRYVRANATTAVIAADDAYTPTLQGMPAQLAAIPKTPTIAVEKTGAKATAVKLLKRSEYATARPGRKISAAAVNRDGIADIQDRVPPKRSKACFSRNLMTPGQRGYSSVEAWISSSL